MQSECRSSSAFFGVLNSRIGVTFFAKDQGSNLDQGSWEWVDSYVPSNCKIRGSVKEHPLWDAIARGKNFTVLG